jgi:hypothetical protein
MNHLRDYIFIGYALAAGSGFASFAGDYTLLESTFNGGGGPASSAHYSTEGSVGEVLFSGTPLSASGVSVGSGYIASFNEPPILQADSISVIGGEPLSIPLVRLLANDSDIEGQKFSIISVSPVSAKGVPITLQGNAVFYNALGRAVGADSFTYTASDEWGNTAEGTVLVNDFAGAGEGPFVQVERVNGSFRLSFTGFAGRKYQIQAAESLTSRNWHTIASSVAGIDGSISFIDPAAASFPVRFYRTIQP